MVNVFITGATGKMGKEIISATEEHPRCNLVGASGSKNNDLIGQDLGELLGREELGIFLSSNFINCNNADVIIDFSFKDYSLMVANYAAENKIPLVIGTTGFNEKEFNELELHAQHIPLLITPNTSRGINFIEQMIEMSGDLLIPFDDIKIEETHNKHKKDMPSGTSKYLSKVINKKLNKKIRDKDIISIRKGDIKGEHKIFIKNEHELLEIKHSVTDRGVFAKGALEAGIWLSSQSKGIYQMSDIHSFSS
jgi:4-hydroxy-tetrahydrodipicolinate reductase